jgi:hypothetical protein
MSLYLSFPLLLLLVALSGALSLILLLISVILWV